MHPYYVLKRIYFIKQTSLINDIQYYLDEIGYFNLYNFILLCSGRHEMSRDKICFYKYISIMFSGVIQLALLIQRN